MCASCHSSAVSTTASSAPRPPPTSSRQCHAYFNWRCTSARGGRRCSIFFFVSAVLMACRFSFLPLFSCSEYQAPIAALVFVCRVWFKQGEGCHGVEIFFFLHSFRQHGIIHSLISLPINNWLSFYILVKISSRVSLRADLHLLCTRWACNFHSYVKCWLYIDVKTSFLTQFV